MRTLAGGEIGPIGFGTYGLGGRGHRDMELTELHDRDIDITAAATAIDAGLNFCEISAGYGHGAAFQRVAAGISASTVERKDVFITHALYPRDLNTFHDITADTAAFERLFDVADSTLVTQSLLKRFGRPLIYKWLEELLDTGRTRAVTLSNAGVAAIDDFSNQFGDRFAAHELHLSPHCQAARHAGVVDATRGAGAHVVIWRPLGRGRSLNNVPATVAGVCDTRGCTPAQAILAWAVGHGWRPMVLSVNVEHITSNAAAASLHLTAAELATIDATPQQLPANAFRWDSKHLDDDLVAAAT